MVLSVEDRLAIYDLIALHGHLMDHGELNRLNELFADAARALGDGNPLGHHVTNAVITEVRDDEVRVLSKGIRIRSDGSSGTLEYDDIVRREVAGWRIARRRVVARRRALSE